MLNYVGLMLAHRLLRWSNVKTTQGQRLGGGGGNVTPSKHKTFV